MQTGEWIITCCLGSVNKYDIYHGYFDALLTVCYTYPNEVGQSGKLVMHPTRKAIVRALKLRGRTTVNDLADLVGIKAITVRHHLHGLQADGFIEIREHRQSVGRPLHYYSLACPYFSWGKRHPEKCEIDAALITTVDDPELPEGSCLLAGDSACTYSLQSA